MIDVNLLPDKKLNSQEGARVKKNVFWAILASLLILLLGIGGNLIFKNYLEQRLLSVSQTEQNLFDEITLNNETINIQYSFFHKFLTIAKVLPERTRIYKVLAEVKNLSGPGVEIESFDLDSNGTFRVTANISNFDSLDKLITDVTQKSLEKPIISGLKQNNNGGYGLSLAGKLLNLDEK